MPPGGGRGEESVYEGYTKKFVARNVAERGRDSTAAILPQYCAQQILGWIHDAIQPLRAILHLLSEP